MQLIIKDGKVIATHDDSQNILNLYSEDMDVIQVDSLDNVPFDEIVVGEIPEDNNNKNQEILPLVITRKEYLDPRIDNPNFKYIDMRNTITEEQKLGQTITDLDLANIELGQKNSDLELKVLSLGQQNSDLELRILALEAK